MAQQQDLPKSTNFYYDIDMTFRSPLDSKEVLLSEDPVKELKDGGQILQEMLPVVDEDRSGGSIRYNGAGPIVGRLLVHITLELVQGIYENKNTLDILTDLTTIFGVTVPLVHKIFVALQMKRKAQVDLSVPCIRITVGGYSIEVESSDWKKGEEAALRLAEHFLKEHLTPNGKNKVEVEAFLKQPVKPTKPKNAPRQPSRRKRSKKKQS
jgi:hypothetical protein